MTRKELGIWFPAIRCGTGADVFTRRLCDGLKERGILVEISWLPHRAEYAPFSVQVPKPPKWATLAHINTWLPSRFVPKQLPIVATVHHSVHNDELTAFKSKMQAMYHRFWIYRTEAACLRKARRIIAVSHYTAKATQKAFGLRNIEVIYNGLDCEQFSPKPRTAPHHPFRLLYVGNWSMRKGVDLLAEILTRLGQEYVLLYTEDQHGRHKSYELPNNCISVGRPSNEELVSIYRDSDALLFPSRLEGFGLVVAEAMACGLPVIATNCSALPEIVQQGVTGWLCKSSAEEFAEACRSVAEPSRWREMRIEARKRIENFFDRQNMIASYIELYEALNE